MDDVAEAVGRDLGAAGPSGWLPAIVETADEHGYFQPLGKSHFAALVERMGSDRTLLVSFERIDDLRPRGAVPFGWEMVKTLGWSSLVLACEGDTFFRDPKVHGYFDRLIDEGFLEDFDRVVFYGAGSCGYAACAFSVAAPGAIVLAVAPVATLDTDRAAWDDRWPALRRTSFTDRYGFAPEMLDAAARAFTIHDPGQRLDDMHASLFARPNVVRLRMRHMGETLAQQLIAMRLLPRLIEKAAEGRLSPQHFARLARVRRNYAPYLRRLLVAVEDRDGPLLARALCRNVSQRLKLPRFTGRLRALERERAEAGDDAAARAGAAE